MKASKVMALKSMTHEDLNSSLSTYEGDHYLACSMLKQSADEIDVVLMALGDNGEPVVHTLLTAIAMRMRFVADIAGEEEEQEDANG